MFQIYVKKKSNHINDVAKKKPKTWPLAENLRPERIVIAFQKTLKKTNLKLP